jgi:hypothetical protein
MTSEKETIAGSASVATSVPLGNRFDRMDGPVPSAISAH